MRFRHPEHPGRALRLAYCLNLHPARDLDQFLDGLEQVSGALARRLTGATAGFGVGMYLPASIALALSADRALFERLRQALTGAGFVPFTWNAFPYGRFHAAGLKEDVFRPTWLEPERLEYTRAVARLAASLAGQPSAGRHLSISTHTGGFGTHVRSQAERESAARGLLAAVAELLEIERETGWRIVLSLEAEPRASCGNTGELLRFLEQVRALAPQVLAVSADDAQAACRRHLGSCLDTCHAAVEFEPPQTAWSNSTAAGPLGKLQFTSALSVVDPGRNPETRAALLALAEPVYLHQTTGLRSDGRGTLRSSDLPELERALAAPASPWLDCREWRCHFHVPVDLASLTDSPARSQAQRGAALGTTRAHADAQLAVALAHPEAWGTDELHVEIETYTWSILPGPARGPGDLVDGLEREYTHVLTQLATHGWEPAPDPT